MSVFAIVIATALRDGEHALNKAILSGGNPHHRRHRGSKYTGGCLQPLSYIMIIHLAIFELGFGSRVPPSDLLDYRVHYNFRAPCCLCIPNAHGCGFSETAIYVALSGPYAGEYVAGCASDTCGYLINLERLYALRGLLVRRYPVRSSGTNTPPPVPYTPTPTHSKTANSEPSVSSSYGGSHGNSDGLFASIATYARPISRPETVLDRLLRLDSHARPGLSEREFNKLFAKCECGLITTRRVFTSHSCAAAVLQPVVSPTVIDLTGDDSDSDDSSSAASPIIIDLTTD
ncbi:hypothetical protein PILCRDRAFT_16633 [Piloderma croceum F 1598]|uniref:Uncharacterized protein n=1 Tax=Piloderma croceum (strain F 1598) TaxID=765440 RepID=A0A0C3EV26_PILCF|nr:hypothetical protein PILCRDRAFT_16633 [Piloderma croceum F 1598]